MYGKLNRSKKVIRYQYSLIDLNFSQQQKNVFYENNKGGKGGNSPLQRLHGKYITLTVSKFSMWQVVTRSKLSIQTFS